MKKNEPKTAVLHFHDEFRNIKSGRRLVEIRRDEHYTYVRPASIFAAHWSKMPNDRFNETFGKVWAVA